MLKTRNIFVDTQTFVGNNFFQNKNLHRLAEYGWLDTVAIYLTEITKNEIQNNIKEELNIAEQEINKFKQTISSKGKILKQIEDYKPYFELPKFDTKLNFEKISDELEAFIKTGKVQFIPYEKADLKSIIDKYFKGDPPFNKGQKKFEFPDAIVLSAIEEWCKEKDTQIYVVSDDEDFKSYTSKYIIPIPKLKVLLDKIIKQYHSDEVAWVSRVFEHNKETIIKKLEKAFEDKVLDELSFDILITRLDVLDIEFFDYSIVEDNSTMSEYFFQFDYDITFTAEVEYSDYSMSPYDKEDDKWYFPERVKREVKISTTQTAEVIIEVYFDDGELPEEAQININSVDTTIPDSNTITDELRGYIFVL